MAIIMWLKEFLNTILIDKLIDLFQTGKKTTKYQQLVVEGLFFVNKLTTMAATEC